MAGLCIIKGCMYKILDASLYIVYSLTFKSRGGGVVMCKGGVTTRGDNQQRRPDRVKKSCLRFVQ